jgi:hypothetical protein
MLNGNLALRYAHFEERIEIISSLSHVKFAIQPIYSSATGDSSKVCKIAFYISLNILFSHFLHGACSAGLFFIRMGLRTFRLRLMPRFHLKHFCNVLRTSLFSLRYRVAKPL